MSQASASIVFKPLTPADLDAVIAIDRAAAGASRRGYFEKRLAAAIRNPRDYVFTGAFDGDALAGFAFAKLDKGAFGRHDASAALDAIGVAPGHGLQGVGHRLLDQIETVLRHKGVPRLTSQVDWDRQPLLNFLAHAGFGLTTSLVLARATGELPRELPEEPAEAARELDFSSPEGDADKPLWRDPFPVRSMSAADLARIIAIDAAGSGLDRTGYFTRKQDENLNQAGIRVSLVAEQDGFPVGFIMARVDYGDFGRTSAEAVLDSVGVAADCRGQGIGQYLMARLLMNLMSLQVETVRTEVEWNDTALIGYLGAVGFAPAQRIALGKDL